MSLAYSSIQFDCHDELTVDGNGSTAGSVPPLNAVIGLQAALSSALAGGPLLMYRMKFAWQASVAGLMYVVCAASVADSVQHLRPAARSGRTCCCRSAPARPPK